MAAEQKREEERDEEVFSDTRERSETNEGQGPVTGGTGVQALPESGTNGNEQTTGATERTDGGNPNSQERRMVLRNGKEVGLPQPNSNAERPPRDILEEQVGGNGNGRNDTNTGSAHESPRRTDELDGRTEEIHLESSMERIRRIMLEREDRQRRAEEERTRRLEENEGRATMRFAADTMGARDLSSPPLHVGGSHQSLVQNGKPKVKITNLTTLDPEEVSIFLNQVKSAEKLGVHIAASTYLTKNAFKLMKKRCKDLTDSWEVMKELEKIADRNKETARDRPLELVTSKLHWSKDPNKSVDWKCTDFFDQMEVLLLEIEEGRPEGLDILLRERFYQAAASKLPAAMQIDASEIAFNRGHQSLEGLKALAKSRLKFIRSGRSRRLNQVSEYQETYPGFEEITNYAYPGPPEGIEQQEYWLNRVDQRKPEQKVVNRQAQASKPSTNQTPVRTARKSNQTAPRNVPVMRPQPQQENKVSPYEGPLRSRNVQPEHDQSLPPQQDDPDFFPGNCWTCGEYGHSSATCKKRRGEMFYRNLEAYRERKGHIRAVGTPKKLDSHLEILSFNDDWMKVPGCFDSGADGNVAPLSLADHGLDVGKMTFNIYYSLPTKEEIVPAAKGFLKIRAIIAGEVIDLGQIHFHFIDHPHWNQVLIGRTTMENLDVLPEQVFIQRLRQNQDPLRQ